MPVHEQRILETTLAGAEAAAERIVVDGAAAAAAAGGLLFGVFRPVIGMSQARIVVITEWPDERAAAANGHRVAAGLTGLETVDRDLWTPTLRPAPGERPAETGGFYSHRAFDIPSERWERFRAITAEAWESWETTHAARVAGLWLCRTPPGPGLTRVRLMAWYESLEAWERSRYWNPGAKAGSERAMELFRERSAMMADTHVAILRRVKP